MFNSFSAGLDHQHGRCFTNMTDVTLCEKLYITYDTKL